MYFECELLIWYMACNFSVGYLSSYWFIEETTLFLFRCLRTLMNFIWPCIHEFSWGSLFWSLGVCIYFYVSIIQLWFLYLCNVLWYQEVRYFDLLFSRLFCLFGILRGSIYIFGFVFFFQFYETDVNILIGGAVNFSLDLGRVEMSIVLSL